jgi:hypothetical protein
MSAHLSDVMAADATTAYVGGILVGVDFPGGVSCTPDHSYTVLTST